ncbi:MAG TPA: ABC transporter ATP-binding protein [Methanoregulaceae archaeon]|nr:ABC transporter ATP-binding protein [Methanoregulaceae archaeon]MDD5684405.1 ABC transporter ATP-binding protein [Methanoregulaceae archaeon]HOP67344.1 ABC transporter ATP-binding protein [Methanoregulaceae archaeon]HPJ73790.1 ABC transporter ATP-binding protein [Methanoregulaceae archaeon]HQC12555.1 ABC transporter ATP-binding protein [Methanoregulaceae archaeon]
MTEPVIEVFNVTFGRNGEKILDNVNLSVDPGDFYAIIGPNGGGKTTLLKIILGLLTQQSGSVRLLGGKPRETRKFCGYVPQFRTFDFRYPITVKEMVLSGRLAYIPGIRKRYRPLDLRMASDAMEKMGVSDLADRQLCSLSGGEQQSAIIARALAGGPRLLLLDEPLVFVDAPTQDHFYDVIEKLRSSMTIVLITHDIGVISTHVTKVACLNHQIYTHGTNEITEDMITSAYQCPVDLIAHGIPHRVLREHDGGEAD